MQVDFTTVKLGRQTVKAFVATLGYSRASYVYFYDNERNESWIDGLRRSFEFFGAVPREVLFDNAKSIVIERDAYGEGEHRWHPNLLDAAKTFGFVPKLCRPYRAKTKGKVERFNQYLKRNFIVPLRATYREVGLELDLATVNAAIGKWLVGTANVRTHDTTKAVPAERLLEELPHMMPLPVMSSAQVEQPAVSLLMTPPPIESLQHPLSLYDTLLGVSYELTV